MITFKVRRCGNGKRSRGFPKFVIGSWHFIYNYNTHTEGYYNLIIK